jgi:hypothetical protein
MPNTVAHPNAHLRLPKSAKRAQDLASADLPALNLYRTCIPTPGSHRTRMRQDCDAI